MAVASGSIVFRFLLYMLGSIISDSCAWQHSIKLVGWYSMNSVKILRPVSSTGFGPTDFPAASCCFCCWWLLCNSFSKNCSLNEQSFLYRAASRSALRQCAWSFFHPVSSRSRTSQLRVGSSEDTVKSE